MVRRMPEIRIQEQFRPAMFRLAAAESAAINELIQLLGKNPDFLNSRSKAQERTARLRKMNPNDGLAIIEAVIPLMYWRASSGASTGDMVSDVVTQLTTEGKPRLKRQDVARFSKALTAILEIKSVTLTAKANAIAGDSPRMYTVSKVISDLRPVFGEDASAAPVGAVILHNLRITYGDGGREEQFFVDMDARDLRELEAQVQRALKKDTALRQFIADADLQLFDPSE
jgi:hypothetical protein